jgi:pimeloyl-ACP methyl ester carboxylesterase
MSSLSHRAGRRTRALLATVVALGATAVVTAQAPASAATAATAATATTAKPTVVLVHGAWADGSSWNGVTARLQRAGYTVEVPPNPLRGLASDAQSLSAYLTTIAGPIVLAGHSYGGAVITDAATGNAAVRALVYVDAYIPDEGETLLALTAAKPGSAFADPAKAFDLLPYPGGPDGDVDLYIKPSVFRADFAADVPAATARIMAATQRPLAASVLQQPSSAPAWKTIPSFAVIGTEDRVIPPAEQAVMAQRAHASITRVAASHVALVSRPGTVAGVIERAAQTGR